MYPFVDHFCDFYIYLLTCLRLLYQFVIICVTFALIFWSFSLTFISFKKYHIYDFVLIYHYLWLLHLFVNNFCEFGQSYSLIISWIFAYICWSFQCLLHWFVNNVYDFCINLLIMSASYVSTCWSFLWFFTWFI